MGELKVNFIVENLNKVKKSLENIKIGGDTKSSSGKSSKGSGGATAGFAFLGGLLGGIISQLDVISGLLGILNGIVNSFVAPFVPILLGLFKPVFILLQLFLKKVLTSGSNPPDAQGNKTSGFEKTTKIIISAIAGIGVAILGAVAGIPALMLGALALIVSGLALIFVGIGKAIGDKISIFADWLSNILLSGVKLIDNFFGTSFKSVLIGIADGILNIFSGIKDILVGIFTLDWKKVNEGFFNLVKGLGQLLFSALLFVINTIKLVFGGFIKLLKGGLEFILSGVKTIASSFVNLFRKGLNLVIGILNKIPGVEIGKISKARAENVSTNISINIEGSADQNTVNAVVQRLRSELSRRGSI